MGIYWESGCGVSEVIVMALSKWCDSMQFGKSDSMQFGARRDVALDDDLSALLGWYISGIQSTARNILSCCFGWQSMVMSLSIDSTKPNWLSINMHFWGLVCSLDCCGSILQSSYEGTFRSLYLFTVSSSSNASGSHFSVNVITETKGTSSWSLLSCKFDPDKWSNSNDVAANSIWNWSDWSAECRLVEVGVEEILQRCHHWVQSSLRFWP